MRFDFHRILKRFLLDAFTGEKLSPLNVAAILTKAIHRPCGTKHRNEIAKIIADKKISHLVHFTPIQNVAGISRYGLIPREYLNCEVLKLALGPLFPDSKRLDGLPEFSCLSVSGTNYKMLYAKRQAEPAQRWAVIVYSAEIMTKLWAEFCATNAASKAPVLRGGQWAECTIFTPPGS